MRHGSPAPSPAAGAPADNARNSSTEETTRSATTTGAAGPDSGAASTDTAETAGSSARMPADAGSGPSNGRANRCSCAIASFSCSVYAGRSTTYRQSRTVAGIASASVAVAIHRTPDRSSEMSR